MLDFWNVFQLPLPLVVTDSRGLDLWVIDPHGFEFPTGRKLKSVARIRDGNSALKEPFVLKDLRAAVVLHFVANNIPGFCCRNFHYFGSYVGNHLAVFAVSLFGHIFVFHFEVFA